MKELIKRLKRLEDAHKPPAPMLFLIEDENGKDKWVTIEGWLKYSRETKECGTKIRTGEPVNYADFKAYLDNMAERVRERYNEIQHFEET